MLRSFLRGREDDSPWVRPLLLALLAGTLLLYTWNLSASGWANSFYSAAAQAGSVSWKAFFFGSSDAAGSITVDKPPMALWPQALAIRAFGLSSWSILLPEALMGVASVGVLYAAVRRWFGPAAGLLAGLVLALTPVATLMFRFNNPEALLTLLMTAAAYTALRAVDDGRLRWFLLTGMFVGFGFLTKQLQVLLVVPGFAIAHLLCGKAGVPRRLRDLGVAFAAMVVAGGWWVAVVELWPAGSRPYIGGSQTDSVLELTLGYNGLGRLTGEETGSVGGGPPGGGAGVGRGGLWGTTGITRMLEGEVGGQIAWLLPAAVAFLLIGLWLTRRAGRTDLRRASMIVWGSWLAVTALTFSFMEGIFHAYYTVALAPAIGALVGAGAVLVWERRSNPLARAAMAAITLATGLWAGVLHGRAPDWHPWLADAVLVFSAITSVAFAVLALPGSLVDGRAAGRIASAAAGAAVVLGLIAPAAWSLETALTAQQGSLVSAGPAVPGTGPGGRGGAPPPGAGNLAAGPLSGGGGRVPQPLGNVGPLPPTARPGDGRPLGPLGPDGGAPAIRGGTPGPGGGIAPFGAGGAAGTSTAPMGPGGGPGGLLAGPEVSEEATRLLGEDSHRYTWVAATTGSQNASSYQLATELPVMPIGGFNGSDPSPTLGQFQEHVADGEIHYYIASGLSGAGSMGGSQEARHIAEWVADNFDPLTVGDATFYDLTSP